jgi:PAS domain S-box-containing protein
METITLWGGWPPIFDLPGRWETFLILAAYAVSFALLLLRVRQDFATLRRRLPLFFILLLVTPLLNNLFILRINAPDLLPPVFPPDLRAPPVVEPVIPLSGLLPVTISAIWLGVGPTLLLGLLAGVIRAGLGTHNVFDPLNFAFAASLASFMLRQDYQGRVGKWIRQPLVAILAAAVVAQPLTLLATFISIYRAGGALATLDYSLSLLSVMAGLALGEALIYGLLFQLFYFLFPQFQPVKAARRPPPYGRTLNRRLQFLFIPTFILIVGIMVFAVGQTALNIATEQALSAIVRDATNGAEGLGQFVSTGYSLIRQFASEPELWSGDEEACQQQLQSSLQMLTYFSRLTAYDPQGTVLCTYPAATPGEIVLSVDEQEALQLIQMTGGFKTTPVHRLPNGQIVLSFVSAMEENGGEQHGVLIGRVEMDLNPLIEQELTSLQWTMHQGEGFVVDEEGRIVVHRNPARLLELWQPDLSQPPLQILPEERGWVRYTRDSRTNARLLACYAKVEGYPWAVVILLPRQVVLGLATGIAGPLLILLTSLAVAVSVVISLATSQITRPLNLLARAAERIAEGNLGEPVQVVSDDEVAQVGRAFEKMRVRLKDRLEDLSLLLQVAQQVSASLDIAQGMPSILEGALGATGAMVARIVLLSAKGEPQVVMRRGESVEGLTALDRALTLSVLEIEPPLIIENLRRARTLIGSDPLPDAIQAVVALPVLSKGTPVAVMWIGFPEPRQFDPSEIDILSTLASQAAVLIENARLFQVAEGGRRRLSAILASTGDAILVTDRDNQLLLVNPAAERALSLSAEVCIGRHVSEVPLQRELAKVLTEPLGVGSPLIEEIPLADGRTFYANASTILSADGEDMGRVVVLRDVTHFKEVDEMKSEFVATVSHDLRAPLTFMRGYTAMMPMVGSLNEKQQEYVEKILIGIDQMSTLIEDLLNLGRIEAGIGLEEKPCHMGAIVVEAVDSLRARATAKGLTLRLEPSDTAPVILGDATLLRQALTNLVDNAIKYTPSGGTVAVGLRVVNQEVQVHVTDTGVGIAPEDQTRLFEKFYRIRRRESEGTPGSGLGLAIVKSIIERHGGRVWVDSALNQGSTFTFALPLRPPAPVEATDSP